jgi:UDP-glucose 4-epimerase
MSDASMKVLVAGGAGFIGSTVASACSDAGMTPIIVDNLSTGRIEFVANREFYEGDISDEILIERIFREHPSISAVVLCAAFINVAESVQNPVYYYRNNVSKCLEFVDHVIGHGCRRLIFSSSASIYQSNDFLSVDEESPIQPVSPYARTKVASEWVLEDISRSGVLRVLSFRYFNPIGADPRMRSGLQSSHPTHALGKMIESMRQGVGFEITGADYPTRDGTGIRDYVHVWDIARAHVTALSKFDQLVTDEKPYLTLNLGTGKGTTVRELLAVFNKISNLPIIAVDVPRRVGDTAGVYANFDKARRLLGWSPNLSIAEGIRDSLKWDEVKHQFLRES